jgi:assimilatory nitrate reductase catalytic subunit
LRVQCGIHIAGPREEAKVTGDATFPVNNGALCVKGWTAAEALNHLDRLLTPLARNARGLLVPVTWDDALARVARGLSDAQAHYGRDAAGIFGGGSLDEREVVFVGQVRARLSRSPTLPRRT